MANTVSILNLTNTFTDWLINTNALARENNNLAANNYVKDTGTLFLSDPTLGLQVANNAIIAGQLQVQGIGSSAFVQNNLRVDQQVYFTNTSLGLTNTGDAIIGGDLFVGGDFVINGTTVYNSNNFTINADSGIGLNSQFSVNRGTSGANAAIRWNEAARYFDILDVNTGIYFPILTNNSNVTTAVYHTVDGTIQRAVVAASANGRPATVPASNNTISITASTANGINLLNPTSNTIDIGLRTTGVAARTYGDASNIPSITVDAFGRVTAVSNTTVSIPPSTSIVANSGQLTANASTGIVALGLPATGVVAGQYGSSLSIPTITVDTFGRVTALTTNNIPNVASAGGYTANTLVFANTTGFIANATGLSYTTSNNTLQVANVNVSGVITNPTFRSYSEAVNTVGVVTTSTYTINLSTANIFDITLANNVTFTFSNPPPAGTLRTTMIILRQGTPGNRLATFNSARYTDGFAPVLSTANNSADVLSFFTVDGGITYFGSLAMANVS